MRKNSKSLREIIYNKIIDELSNGRITPGENLNERQLAKQFHVSRTPVREAFAQLEKVGVIVFNSKTGAVVRKVTLKQIEEVLNIISVLEGYAAETAVTNGIEGKDLTYIKQIGKEMEANAKDKDYFKFAETNRKFHEFIVKMAGNSTLEDILKELNRKIFTGGLTVPFYIDQYSLKHKIIIDAISKRLPVKARMAMREHNQDIKKFLVETLRQFKGINPLNF